MDKKDNMQFPISLRDYFATHAPEMPSWYYDELCSREIPVNDRMSEWDAFYQWRWEYADQMLKEREK